MAVDWAAVEERMPIAQIPAAQEKRDDLFRALDRSKNGYLSKIEIVAGMPGFLALSDQRKRGEATSYVIPLKDFKPAVQCAFNAAKKIAPSTAKGRKARETHATCVDRREFHALIVAFRTYAELAVMFEHIDADESRTLNWKESKQALELLAGWKITEEQVRAKFPDDWTQSMKFDDFADWCISRRFGKLDLHLDENDAVECLKDKAGGGAAGELLKAFEDWDTDGNGFISAEELADVLVRLDPNFTKEQALGLFSGMDINKDGRVDYIEFAKWVTDED